MRKNKLLSLIKFGIPMLLSTFWLINETPSTIVEAAKGVSHIGTFNGSTTFRTSSSNGINPGLFIEVMDEYGRLTQYESEDGVITIPDTKEGAYVTQAKLLGKTKYKDIDSGEILDTWEESRNLKLESSKMPVLTTNGKNLFDGKVSSNGQLVYTTCTVNSNYKNFWTTEYFNVEPNKNYSFTMGDSSRYCLYDENKKYISGKNSQSFNTGNATYVRLCGKNQDVTLVYGTEVPVTHEPYKTSILTTNEEVELRGIGDVRDELDLMTGEVTQSIEEFVLSNQKEWVHNAVFQAKGYLAFYYIGLTNKLEGRLNFIADKFPVTREALGGETLKPMEVMFGEPNTKYFYIQLIKDRFETHDTPGLIKYLKENPITIHYQLQTTIVNQLNLRHTYTFPPVKGQSVAVNGTVSATIGSITVPTEPLSFTLNPNLEEGQQFVAPEFSVTNDNHAPITLGIKSFAQITDILNDVSPDNYLSWEGLNKTESKDIALALVPQSSDNWVSLTEKPYYVVTSTNETIGRIKGNSSVEFSFEALHGQAFDKTLRPEYQLTFVFEF